MRKPVPVSLYAPTSHRENRSRGKEKKYGGTEYILVPTVTVWKIFKGRGARADSCGPPLIHTYIKVYGQLVCSEYEFFNKRKFKEHYSIQVPIQVKKSILYTYQCNHLSIE
jgi:hypothetical protein